MTGASILGFIIYKHSYYLKFSLIVLLKIDKSLKLAIYRAIFLLYLAIYLLIKRGREPLFDIKEIAEQ